MAGVTYGELVAMNAQKALEVLTPYSPTLRLFCGSGSGAGSAAGVWGVNPADTSVSSWVYPDEPDYEYPIDLRDSQNPMVSATDGAQAGSRRRVGTLSALAAGEDAKVIADRLTLYRQEWTDGPVVFRPMVMVDDESADIEMVTTHELMQTVEVRLIVKRARSKAL